LTSGIHLRLRIASVVVLLVLGCGGSQQAEDAAPRAASTNPWSRLHRPLRIPAHKPGTPCPRTRGGKAAPDTGITLGPGPVYPVLGMAAAPPSPDGVVDVRDDDVRAGREFHKTLLAVAPKQRGRVLVRGTKLGGAKIMFYLGPPLTGKSTRLKTQPELRLPGVKGRQRKWRYQPLDSVLTGPGCYLLQFDTAKNSRLVAFEVIRSK
jgi:hypothetical protein